VQDRGAFVPHLREAGDRDAFMQAVAGADALDWLSLAADMKQGSRAA
jgi:hypothetical protein